MISKPKIPFNLPISNSLHIFWKFSNSLSKKLHDSANAVDISDDVSITTQKFFLFVFEANLSDTAGVDRD